MGLGCGVYRLVLRCGLQGMGFMGIPRETWCVCRKEKGLVKGSRYSNNGALDPQAPEFKWPWASKTLSSAYGLDLLIQVFRV